MFMIWFLSLYIFEIKKNNFNDFGRYTTCKLFKIVMVKCVIWTNNNWYNYDNDQGQKKFNNIRIRRSKYHDKFKGQNKPKFDFSCDFYDIVLFIS